jgi:hypothetical protein
VDHVNSFKAHGVALWQEWGTLLRSRILQRRLQQGPEWLWCQVGTRLESAGVVYGRTAWLPFADRW